LSFKWNYWT